MVTATMEAARTANGAKLPGSETATAIVPVAARNGELIANGNGVALPANLFDALAVAQAKCPKADKTGSNSQLGGKSYATAEDVIEAAQEAMSGTGLSVIPLRRIPSSDRENLVAVYRICHSSGEYQDTEIVFPVVVSATGKVAYDWSYMKALTECYAYTLRDILKMPKAMQDPAAGNAAAARVPAAAPPPVQPAAATNSTPAATSTPVPPPSAEPLYPEDAERIALWPKIGDLCKRLNVTSERWREKLATFARPDGKPVERVKDLSTAQANDLLKKMEGAWSKHMEGRSEFGAPAAGGSPSADGFSSPGEPRF